MDIVCALCCTVDPQVETKLAPAVLCDSPKLSWKLAPASWCQLSLILKTKLMTNSSSCSAICVPSYINIACPMQLCRMKVLLPGLGGKGVGCYSMVFITSYHTCKFRKFSFKISLKFNSNKNYIMTVLWSSKIARAASLALPLLPTSLCCTL